MAGGVTAPGAHASTEPDPESGASAADGAAYLADTQGDDGSVPEGWGADGVAEAVVALVAGGGQDAAVDDALDYLAEAAPERIEDDGVNGGHVGRIVSGLVVAGEDPRAFAGVDFVAEVESHHDPTGSYGANLYGDALAVLGLLAAGAEVPDDAVDRLRINQCSSGAWSWRSACSGTPDTDTTALAASALAAVAGPDDEDVEQARGWLLDTQNDSGCWGLEADDVDNANSCGLALSTVVAFGEDPGSPPWTEGERSSLEALRDLQVDSGADAGAFWYQADTPGAKDYATVQAVPGMAHRAYPVSAPGAPPSENEPEDDGDTGDGDTGDDESGDGDSGSSSTDSDGSDGTDGSDTGSTSSPSTSSTTSSTTTANDLEAAAGLGSSSSSTTTTTGSAVDDAEVGVTTTTRPALGWTTLGDSSGFDEAGDQPARRAAGRPPSLTANLDGSGGTSEIPTVAAGTAGVMLASGVLGTGWWWRRRRLAGIEIAAVSEPSQASGASGTGDD